MIKPRLRKINLIPEAQTGLKTISYIEELCRLFQIDLDTDFRKTRKLRVWHRPCHKELYIF